MKDYQHQTVDVVSLAEIKAMIQGTTELSNEMKIPIITVLEHVEQNMRYVPNDRRKEITLGDYMKKHHYVNVSSLTEFSNDILKNIISRTLGEKTNVAQVDNIDWEYAKYRTHPQTHKDENKRVETLYKEQKTALSQTQIDSMIDRIINKSELDLPKKNFTVVNPRTGQFESFNAQDHAHNEIMRDCLENCKLKSDFIPIKDYFHNLILRTYADPDFKQEQVERIIQKYTELRLNDCLMTPNFKQKLQSDNGHMYIKVLREHVVDELNLTKEPKLQEFNY